MSFDIHNLQIVNTYLGTLTRNVDPRESNTVAFARELTARAKEWGAGVLCANQCGSTQRVAYMDFKRAGTICNLDVSIEFEGQESIKLYDKPVRIFNSDSKKILVPVYQKVRVSYTLIGTGERVETTSEDPDHNVMWYGAAMILNGAVQWCAWDYGTYRRDGAKVKQNAPCPCGKTEHGKPVKYKKCCGLKRL